MNIEGPREDLYPPPTPEPMIHPVAKKAARGALRMGYIFSGVLHILLGLFALGTTVSVLLEHKFRILTQIGMFLGGMLISVVFLWKGFGLLKDKD